MFTLGGREWLQGAPGIKVVIYFLIWMLVRQVCSLYENSLGGTLKIFMYILHFNQKVKNIDHCCKEKKKGEGIHGDWGGAQHLSNRILIHSPRRPPQCLPAHPEMLDRNPVCSNDEWKLVSEVLCYSGATAKNPTPLPLPPLQPISITLAKYRPKVDFSVKLS